ncbi:hypothetical protein Tco_0729359 [Tanacetum coccineum]|uniref:Secreted protein n=1 Tax=Tanacetum coccineum TaxID=301880 RepID=A0ABQ4YS71_9ASTR
MVPTILIVGLAIVLHGRKAGWSDLVCHRWRTGTEFTWLEIVASACEITQLCSTAFTGAGAGTGDVCLSRSRALTISFNSATSGDSPEVEALQISGALLVPKLPTSGGVKESCHSHLRHSKSIKLVKLRVFHDVDMLGEDLEQQLRPRIPRWEPGAILP